MTTAALPPPPHLRPAEIAVFLDVDGTLLEIEHEPDAVVVPKGLLSVLRALHEATGGALALVSGRPLEQLDHLFAPLRLNAAGLHGLERRNLIAGTTRAERKPALFDEARDELARFAGARPGVMLEDKGLTLALHYRGAPDQRDSAARAVHGLAEASAGALIVLAGKMVFELKPPGVDKGHAIEAFLEEPPFAGRRPVFAGDDVTDEAGFRVVNAAGGLSIRVGTPGERASAAVRCLDDVSTMHAWLAGLIGNGGTRLTRGRAVA
jgi:trehalose 6-phosphate phosphatase